MPKVIVQTIVSETTNAAAAANTGRQRAAIHSRIGNSRAPGRIVCHGSGGSETIVAVIIANTRSATTPSTICLLGGVLRRASARPITSGATVIMPTASDANPVLPSGPDRSRWAVEQLISHRPTDTRGGGCDDCGRQQTQHIA